MKTKWVLASIKNILVVMSILMCAGARTGEQDVKEKHKLSYDQTKALKMYTTYYNVVDRMDLGALHLGEYSLTNDNPQCPKTVSIQLESPTSYIMYQLHYPNADQYAQLYKELVSPLVIAKGKEVTLSTYINDPEILMMGGLFLMAGGFVPTDKHRTKWSANEVEFWSSDRANLFWGGLPVVGDAQRRQLSFVPSENRLQLIMENWKSTIFNIRKKKSFRHVECGYKLIPGPASLLPITLPSPEAMRDIVEQGLCGADLAKFGSGHKSNRHQYMVWLLKCVNDHMER